MITTHKLNLQNSKFNWTEESIRKIKKMCEERVFVGTFHDESQVNSMVDIMKVSHKINKVDIIDLKNIEIDVETLNTPMGKNLQQLIDLKLIEFLPNGTGNLTKDGFIENYKLISIDAFPIKT